VFSTCINLFVKTIRNRPVFSQRVGVDLLHHRQQHAAGGGSIGLGVAKNYFPVPLQVGQIIFLSPPHEWHSFPFTLPFPRHTGQ
jgi:hypothetical protein